MVATFTFDPGFVFSGDPGYTIDLRTSGIVPIPVVADQNVTSTSNMDPLAEPVLTTTRYQTFSTELVGKFVVERVGTSTQVGLWWQANYVESFLEDQSFVTRVDPSIGGQFDPHYKINFGRNAAYASIQGLKIGALVKAGDNIVGSANADTLRTTDVWETIKAGGGNDFIDARSGDDKVFGGAGNDKLFGGIGIDKIYGEAGADALTGGAGNDLFIYANRAQSVGANVDTIMDFDKAGNDRIDLSAIYGPKLAFIKGAAFTKIGQVRINDVPGADVIVEANVTGSLTADFSVRIKATGLAAMGLDDFIL